MVKAYRHAATLFIGINGFSISRKVSKEVYLDTVLSNPTKYNLDSHSHLIDNDALWSIFDELRITAKELFKKG